MTAPAWTRGLTVTGWVASFLALVAVILIAWWILIGEPAHDRQADANAKVGQTAAQARTDSAKDAAGINDAARDAAAANEAQTGDTANAIRQAPGADQRLNRDLNGTGLDRVCLRATYRQRPECVQRLGGAQPKSGR